MWVQNSGLEDFSIGKDAPSHSNHMTFRNIAEIGTFVIDSDIRDRGMSG